MSFKHNELEIMMTFYERLPADLLKHDPYLNSSFKYHYSSINELIHVRHLKYYLDHSKSHLMLTTIPFMFALIILLPFPWTNLKL